MRQLSEIEGQPVEWIQPKTFERLYQLRSGQEVLAALTFRSSTGTMATAETTEGRWTFKRVGFLNPRVTVRAAGSEEDLAVYQPKFWGDGVLSFNAGCVWAWKPTNFWATDWAFFDSEGTAVMEFRSGVEKEKLSDIFKTQFTVVFHHTRTVREAVPLLVTLGMYLLVLHQQDAAAAAAVTASTAGAS
jgi:hypothetical protein